MSTTPAVGRPSSTTEHWRPTAHFTTTRHWLNDPNGLLYRDGTWHLFFQTNPHGSTWGEIGWGHATSTDLVTGTEQPNGGELRLGPTVRMAYVDCTGHPKVPDAHGPLVLIDPVLRSADGD